MNDPIFDICRLVESGQQEAALIKATEALQSTPNDPQLLYLAGIAALRTGRNETAAHLLERVLSFGWNPECFNALGAAYAGLGKLPDFFAQYAEALAKPKISNELCNQARIFARKAAYESAEQLVAHALNFLPSNADVHLLLGQMRFSRGFFERAKADYSSSLTLRGETLSGRELLVVPAITAKEYCKRAGSRYFQVLPEEMIPQYYIASDTNFETDFDSIMLPRPEQYVAEIKDASVFGVSNVILTGRDAVVYDAVFHPSAERTDFVMSDPIARYHTGSNFLLDMPQSPERTFKQAIMVAGVASDHWFHFLFEHAPMFWLMDHIPDLNNVPILFNEAGFADLQIRAVLQKLNRAGREVILLKRGQRYHCETLFLPSRMTFIVKDYKDGCPKNVVDRVIDPRTVYYLRNTLMGGQEVPQERTRIYIPRRNSPYRRLADEDRIEKLFCQNGFVSVEPHTMSLDEKLELFRTAEIIAGAGGTGHFNVMFAPPDCKVLQMYPPEGYGSNEGPTVFKFLNVTVYGLCGENIPGTHPIPYHCDLKVDFEQLKKLLAHVIPNLASSRSKKSLACQLME